MDDTIQIASMVLKNRLAGIVLAVNSPESTKSLVERDVKQPSVRFFKESDPSCYCTMEEM